MTDLALFFVSPALRDRDPQVAAWEAEGMSLLSDGWVLPRGTIDLLKKHYGIRSDFRPWLVRLFTRFICERPQVLPIILPEDHDGVVYLGLLKGRDVVCWPSRCDLKTLRKRIVQAVLAYDVHVQTQRLTVTLAVYNRAYHPQTTDDIEQHLAHIEAEWREASGDDDRLTD